MCAFARPLYCAEIGFVTSEIETCLGVQFRTEPISTGFNFQHPPKESIITPAVRNLITVCVVGLALLVIIVGVITLVNIAQLRAEKAAQEETAKASEEVKISPEPVEHTAPAPKSELATADVKKADVDWVRATAASANIPVTALAVYLWVYRCFRFPFADPGAATATDRLYSLHCNSCCTDCNVNATATQKTSHRI
ncbi:hypothetical protein KJY77_04060 [Canibacter sp. lx-72]|uniref:hypothetical protein n=1 Tax=Canibacter zhuwentaonis TaxID=2837491 RepID=UPI001BDD692B|nr:hypothetical protein [Canibacter zhuwentaonis]MBT1018313.1 hypothetical protein [Canibacter zhuwentaonis]